MMVGVRSPNGSSPRSYGVRAPSPRRVIHERVRAISSELHSPSAAPRCQIECLAVAVTATERIRAAVAHQVAALLIDRVELRTDYVEARAAVLPAASPKT